MRLPLSVLVVFAVAQTALADPIYRWVDDQGVTHYTNRPASIPPGVKAEITSGDEIGYVGSHPSGPMLHNERPEESCVGWSGCCGKPPHRFGDSAKNPCEAPCIPCKQQRSRLLPRKDPPAKSTDPCAGQESQLEARRLWLRDRIAEQVKIPSEKHTEVQTVAGAYCPSHLIDPQCKFGDPPVPPHPDQLTLEEQTRLEERDQHVIELKRELDACRRQHPHPTEKAQRSPAQ